MMKFRIKFNSQTYSLIFDNINENLLVNDLKMKIKQHLLSLKNFHFHLSLNGKDVLNDNQTISQTGLVNGDTIYILNDSNNENLSLLSTSFNDQPLTIDEIENSNRYPILIHRLVEYSKPENDFDYIVIIIHALMIESGFQMDAENNYDLRIARKSSTFYVIRYRHKLCEEERIRCSLAIMKTDSLITIDGVVNSISQACGKLSFHIGNYLHTQKEISNSIYPYHDLRQFSRLFKDNLANRLLCKLLEESGQRSTATLIGLPNEIKLRLAKYLPIKSLMALQLTCRDFHNTLKDNLLWHDLCIRDFDKTSLTSISKSNEKDWYKIYRITFAQKQATLRHQNKCSTFFQPAFVSLAPPVHPTHRVLFPDPTNTVPAAFHPFPPTIYRHVPSGIFRICTTNIQQAQTTQQQQGQHHIYCQPFVGLKWVVIFAAATMIPLPPCFHPIWLG